AAALGRREPQAMVILWLEYVGTAAVEARAGHDPALDPEQQAVPVVVVRRPLGHDPTGTGGVERRLVDAGAPALLGGTVQLPLRHPPLNEHLVGDRVVVPIECEQSMQGLRQIHRLALRDVPMAMRSSDSDRRPRL